MGEWWSKYYRNHRGFKNSCSKEQSKKQLTDTDGGRVAKRGYASVMRLSDRLVKWILESMFVPNKFFWTLDELLFRTVCEIKAQELDDGCKYYPISAVRVNPEASLNYYNDEEYGRVDPNWITQYDILRANSREDLFENYLRKGYTKNQLWHWIKLEDVLPEETWLS